MKIVQTGKSGYESPQLNLLLVSNDVILVSGNMEDLDVGKDTVPWD
ncbi:MAG: hypothetical protein IJA88_02490 [Clostridia bacterium]|nr:hypothetical protein [Clostridia bacterium]